MSTQSTDLRSWGELSHDEFFAVSHCALVGLCDLYDAYGEKEEGIQNGETSTLPYEKILPEYLNKKCELTIKDAMPAIDVMFSVTGTLVDLDDQWLMLEVETKKKTIKKLLRVDSVKGVKEIKG